MPITQFHKLSTHHQTAYHNLCTSKDPPPGVDKLLWNGLKFCLQKPLPKPNIDSTCLRLTEDVRRKHYWSTHGDGDNSDYNPKLYIRSQWTAPEAPAPLELALQNFQTALHQQTRDNLSAQPRQHNLPASHQKLLQELSNNKDFTITATDKNLGPAILERSVYKQRCLSDHLEDKNTYQRLAPDDVTLRMASAEGAMHLLVKRHEKHLSRAETVYFTRCLQEPRRVPQFYCTPKVHKTPWATRPIVSCVNSRMGDLSKWIDAQLQQVVHLCPSHLKDSQTLLQLLKSLGKLPTTAVLSVSDAKSMYTNIQTTHGLNTLKRWLLLHAHELPKTFPRI